MFSLQNVERFVVQHVLLNSHQTTQGTVTFTAERILFVSQQMMKEIAGTVLPNLVNPILEERRVSIN